MIRLKKGQATIKRINQSKRKMTSGYIRGLSNVFDKKLAIIKKAAEDLVAFTSKERHKFLNRLKNINKRYEEVI